MKKYGVKDIVVGVWYKADQFRKTVGQISKKMKINVSISVENKPLGTGGGLRNAYPFFKKQTEPFFVFNGDVIGDFNLDRIMGFHKEKGADVTIGLVRVSNPSSYGLVMVDSEMQVKKFIEKPRHEEIVCDTVNAGIYIFSPDIFHEIPAGKSISLEREVIPLLLEKGKKIYGYIHYGYWMDVGTIEKYKKANFDVLEGKIEIFDIKKENGNLIRGNRSVLKEGVQIKGRVIIGEECFIGSDCVIEDSIIMGNTIVMDNCVIKNSIIGRDVIIENDSIIENIALSNRSYIRAFTLLM